MAYFKKYVELYVHLYFIYFKNMLIAFTFVMVFITFLFKINVVCCIKHKYYILSLQLQYLGRATRFFCKGDPCFLI